MKVLAVIILVIFVIFSITLIGVCFGERRREVSLIAHTINAVVCVPVEVFMILFLCGLH